MKETLPSYQAMMPVLLEMLADGAEHPLRELFERICQHSCTGSLAAND